LFQLYRAFVPALDKQEQADCLLAGTSDLSRAKPDDLFVRRDRFGFPLINPSPKLGHVRRISIMLLFVQL
jgi:hypothetical protein